MTVLKEGFDRSMPTSAALGFFDGVHKGHTAVIKSAADKGLQTIVVTFENAVWKTDNGKPCGEITSKALKERILKSLGVDAVIYLDYPKVKNMEPGDFIKNLCSFFNLKFISAGFNYRFGKEASAGIGELKGYCRELDTEVSAIAPVCLNGQPLSSTRIREALSSGAADKALEMLGRPFAFYSEVVRGRQIGRTLGTPTINQVLEPTQLLPKFGVYASLVYIDGKEHFGVTNIGVKPTIAEHLAPLCETHIIGFSGDLYGQVLQVDIIKFIRPEMKFENLDKLKEQMNKDSCSAKKALIQYKLNGEL